MSQPKDFIKYYEYNNVRYKTKEEAWTAVEEDLAQNYNNGLPPEEEIEMAFDFYVDEVDIEVPEEQISIFDDELLGG